MPSTIRIILISFLTSLWLCLSIPAFAQSDGEKFGNWLYSCADGPCKGYFSLKHPLDEATTLSLWLLRDTDLKQTTLIVTLPKMTDLRPGIQLFMPGLPPLAISFEFCNDEGCTGFAQLQPEQLAVLNSEANIDVRFFKYGQVGASSLIVPIRGFAALYKRLG